MDRTRDRKFLPQVSLLQQLLKVEHQVYPHDSVKPPPSVSAMSGVSFIDLITGIQPMRNEHRSVWIAFNGTRIRFGHAIQLAGFITRKHSPRGGRASASRRQWNESARERDVSPPDERERAI